jgi:hypothetical protein
MTNTAYRPKTSWIKDVSGGILKNQYISLISNREGGKLTHPKYEGRLAQYPICIKAIKPKTNFAVRLLLRFL